MINNMTIPARHDRQLNTKFEREPTSSTQADVLADIYRDDVNIATWQRSVPSDLSAAAQRIIDSKPFFKVSTSVSQYDAYDSLYDVLGANSDAQLVSDDVAEIVVMFCCLFDLEQVGLRLATLDRAMCPKFHVDRVPCRLVTTYSGVATEWLRHEVVDRSKLGVGSKGKSDEESGLYLESSDIQQLEEGDVALLKGESWLGNEGGGLVHRSPQLCDTQKRLLLTLDFV